MPAAKILVIPGSLRTGSHNARLAALATKELALLDAEVTRISLEDYELRCSMLIWRRLPDRRLRRSSCGRRSSRIAASLLLARNTAPRLLRF
jgi:hypothetical protein